MFLLIEVDNIQTQEWKGTIKDDDMANDKIEFFYWLLVHDKSITPLPAVRVTLKTMKHKQTLRASAYN